MISIFPFAFVAFVLFLAMICGGRACGGRAMLRPAVPAALVVASLLLLMLGGLLLGGALYMSRSVNISPPPFPPRVAEVWPIPVAAPRSVPEVSPNGVQDEFKSLVAEAPDSTDAAAPPATSSSLESFSPARPAWMDAPMGRVNGIYRRRVTVGPWTTLTECEKELPTALREAVQTYADRYLGEGKGQYVNLKMQEIHDVIVRGEWEERRQGMIEPIIFLHALLEFDSEANRMIDASVRNSVIGGRLAYTAAGCGGVLSLITILFGYLKLDTLTRGYYTGRLRLTAAAAILALAVIAGFLVMP